MKMVGDQKTEITYNSALIIDDEELELFLGKKTLMENNVTERVYTETSVRSALHFLRNTSELPELIFIDEKMREFVNNLAHFPFHTTRKCKVFVLSYNNVSISKIVKETEAQHLYLKYIPKPINIDFLFEENNS